MLCLYIVCMYIVHPPHILKHVYSRRQRRKESRSNQTGPNKLKMRHFSFFLNFPRGCLGPANPENWEGTWKPFMRLTFGRHINRELNGRFENRNLRYRTKVPKKKCWFVLLDRFGARQYSIWKKNTHNKKKKAKTVLYSISHTIRLERTALHWTAKIGLTWTEEMVWPIDK